MQVNGLRRFFNRLFRRPPRALPPGSGRAARGRFGEDLAEDFCRRKLGYRVVARNWRRKRDELDLVCRDGEVLVFIEVRARAEGALVPGVHSIRERKKAVLLRACKNYLSCLHQPPKHFRFDIIDVVISARGEGEVRHYANVPLFSKHFIADRRSL